MGVGGPDFRAVQHIVVAVAGGAKLQRGQVRSRSRLGIALAPIVLAGQDARQIEVPLRRRAVAHDAGADHPQAHRRKARRPRRRALGGEDIALHLVPAGPAVLDRPAGRDPALGVQPPLPRQAVFRLAEHAGDQTPGGAQVRAQRLVEKGAHLVAEGQFGSGQGQVHGVAFLWDHRESLASFRVGSARRQMSLTAAARRTQGWGLTPISPHFPSPVRCSVGRAGAMAMIRKIPPSSHLWRGWPGWRLQRPATPPTHHPGTSISSRAKPRGSSTPR